MRVCLICFAGYPDQGATYFYEISRSLAALGHDVSAIAVQRAESEATEAVEDGVHIRRVPLALTVKWGSPRRWLAKSLFLWRAAQILRAGRFDIVHVYCTIGAFALPALVGRRPKWVQEHQTGAVSSRSEWMRSLEDRARAFQGRFFDINLTVSSALGERLFGNASRFQEMPAGVNLRLFRPGLPRDFRNELGIPPDHTVFVHAGVLEAGRGTDVPVRAFARALGENDRLWLLMPGRGAQLEELRALARDLNVAERVWLPGYVPYESLPRIFAAADAGLSYLPAVTYYEGQPPMKVMEYLGAGLPVIASDVSSHRVRVHHLENGLLAAPEVEAYARALIEFAADPHLRRRLSSSAAASVVDLTYDRIVDQRLVPVYQRLLATALT